MTRWGEPVVQRSFCAYSDGFSLARLLGRVENGLLVGLFFILANLLFDGAGITLSTVAHAESDMMSEPLPQTDLGPSSDYSEALKLMNQKKWAEAAIVLRSILKAEPGSMTAMLTLSRSLVYSGRREEALGLLSQAVAREKGPRKVSRRVDLMRRIRVMSRLFLTNSTFQIYQEGLNLIDSRKYKLARERFDKALAIEPDNIEILLRSAQCFVLDGEYDSAAERLKLARRLNPYEPEIRLWLGRALHERGEIQPALEDLRVADQELKGSELAPVWLAEALASSSQREFAIRVLLEDIRDYPLHVPSLLTLARMRADDSDSNALWSTRKDLQVALSRLGEYTAPDRPRFESELGVELRQSQEELKEQIQKILHKIEENPPE